MLVLCRENTQLVIILKHKNVLGRFVSCHDDRFMNSCFLQCRVNP